MGPGSTDKSTGSRVTRPVGSISGWMFRVCKFEQFDRRAVLDDERHADTVGWAVRRNKDFAAGKLGGKVGHFKRNVCHPPDEIRNRRVRFEAHPFHAEFAFLD